MKEFYKIRRKGTNLYSTGGMSIRWSKTGKVWKKKGDISSHFTLLAQNNRTDVYIDCEVVRIAVVETEMESVDVTHWANAAADRQQLKAEAAAQSWAAHKERYGLK